MTEPISLGDAPPPAAHPQLLRIGKVLSALSTGALYVAGAGLVAMSLIVLWQVIVSAFAARFRRLREWRH